jgi:RNA polymerase sigma-70 factor (sigma-E family)
MLRRATRRECDAEFEAWVRDRRGALVRSATVLAAGDAHLAEDLVQGCLVRLYAAWPRARRTNIDAYVRRMLVNAAVDEHRRPFTRRERAVDPVPDRPMPEAAGPGLHDEALVRALGELPVGMRAAVVLRYVDGLSVDEACAALGCSSGNVKSQAARGLARLREILGGSQASREADADTGPQIINHEGDQAWTA